MVDKVQFEAARRTPDVDAKQVRSAVEDKGVVQEVDNALAEAVGSGATDIHFEPQPEGLIVRVRVDGAMTTVKEVPDRMKGNVLNRIKVLSGMDITKSRIPQSGFFKMMAGERRIELYVYALPTLYGECITVKVQYKQSATLRLDQLGMSPAVLTSYRKALSRTAGLYLVTGPPGSGKRTTIYGSILEVLKPNMLAMGFDPVIKYELPGMIQGKPEDRSEFTFAEAILSLFQQEPDVAYIGDILNEQEARATISGAFARRRVFARMTANDTVNAIQNIVDMGVQPFLMAASTAAVLNQRLLQRLCPSCRESYDSDEAIQKEVGLKLPPNARFFKARGCDACKGTGYQGVVAIYELYLPSEELNKMLVGKASVGEVRQRAVREGLISLKVDGVLKALAGYCTLEEVLNAL
ncbi:MAG: GspE/PulE family protein [Acidobacteriota bacterium]